MNTSSRMMSFGQEQNVHVSAAVKGLLPASYTVKERGKVTVKGKGEMTTYWVESKANRVPPSEADIQAALAVLAAKPVAAGAMDRDCRTAGRLLC